jgi:8-hydroxy-5-deazaflavin:NADPH oxidoreductase
VFGEVVLYGVRGVPPAEVLGSADTLAGKVVVDMNNGPIPDDHSIGPAGPSLAERLAAAAPGARVVKAFNTMAQEVFDLAPEPLRDHRVSAFLAGDDEDAKRVVAGLAEELGFVPLDAGPLQAARMLEGLADFIRHAMGRVGLGPTATISVHVLPAPAAPSRLGGRQASALA